MDGVVKQMPAGGAHRTDVAVIGTGPVGLFALFELGMLKLGCHAVDALDHVGGQCTALYPEKPIYDIPGFPSIAAAQLITNLSVQAAPFHPTYHLGQQVTGLSQQEDGRFLLTTSAGTRIDAGAVVIAAGCGAFGPNRPPLAGIEDYEGRSVFYYVQRREDFRGKRVVIAGGGDSAVDWAISLAEVAAKVMVVHRRPKFRAAPESADRLQKLADDGVIEMVIPYQLAGLAGEDGQLHQVIVSDLQNKEKALDADILLPFFGLSMNLGPILDWNLSIEKNHIQVDPASCQTSIPGIFAIGDIAQYGHKLKLILSGFAEAATAAHAARRHLHPGEALHFEYSTSKGVPGA